MIPETPFPPKSGMNFFGNTNKKLVKNSEKFLINQKKWDFSGMRFFKITELPEKMRYSSTSHIFDPYDLFFDSIYTHKKESGRYL